MSKVPEFKFFSPPIIKEGAPGLVSIKESLRPYTPEEMEAEMLDLFGGVARHADEVVQECQKIGCKK